MSVRLERILYPCEPSDARAPFELAQALASRSRGQVRTLTVPRGADDEGVAAAILSAADEWPADVVVLPLAGGRARGGWALGPVMDSLLRRCPCPVLGVPAAAPGRPVVLSNILCPFDFSEPSRRALDYALALAGEARAHVILLHILEWFPEEPDDVPLLLPECQLDLGAETRARLASVIPPGTLEECDHEEIVATGSPHRAILRVGRRIGADLVVLGVHGRRPIDDVLPGGTVSHLMREANCPVLAVRPH